MTPDHHLLVILATASHADLSLSALYCLLRAPARLGHLAEELGISSAGVTSVVDTLIMRGLAEKHHWNAFQDRRAVWLRLTPKGEELVERIKNI